MYDSTATRCSNYPLPRCCLQGASNPISMFDGYNFIGAKAYKDSKLCLMMLSNILHDKYNKQTGIAFSSIYPGCIAESPLFREKVTPNPNPNAAANTQD